MIIDRPTLDFLNRFSEETRRSGTLLQQEGRVEQIFGSDLRVHARVRDGGDVLETTLSFEDNRWDGSSTSGAEDCPALYATMLERVERGDDLPKAPSEVENEPLRERVTRQLGRRLDLGEERYLETLEKRYRRFVLTGEIHDHDLVRLARKWDVRSYEPLELWPEPPRDILEFWNYIAYAFQSRKVPYPEFMEAVTDLESVFRRVRGWEEEREVETWSAAISEALRRPSRQPVRGLHFALRVTMSEARLLSRPDAAAPWSPVSRSAEWDRLAQAYREGALALDAASELIWSTLFTHWETTGAQEFSLESPEAGSALNRLFRVPELRDRMLTLDDEPFEQPAEPLRWVCREETGSPAASGGDLALQLLDALGEEIPYALRLLPGSEPLYLTDEAAWPGPPSWTSGTEIQPAFRLPRAAVATPAGVEFLHLLGADLPPSLRDRVEERFLEVTLRARLRAPERETDPEMVFLTAEAADSDGLRREMLERGEWRVLREPRSGGKVLRFDRSALQGIPALVEDLSSSWDPAASAYRIRVTRNFPDRFAAWADTLPPTVRLDLDEHLASLLDQPVEAAVRFSARQRGIDWFDLQIEIDAGPANLSQDEVQALVTARGGFVRLASGKWMRLRLQLSDEQREAVSILGIDPFDSSGAKHRMHVMQLADPATRSVFDQDSWGRIATRAADLKLQVQPRLPAGLSVTLRPYQVEGYRYLAYLTSNRFGGILADDMGLGKTVQSLAWLLWLRDSAQEARPSLVVCPKSVLDVWAAEIAKCAPSLRYVILRNREELDVEHVRTQIDVLIINYAFLRGCIDELKGIDWLAVILDEGQQIKNPQSKAARSARALQASNRLVLTGTPLENRLLDVWSLMAFAMPGILGEQAYFRRHFDRRRDVEAQNRLSSRLRPFLLRRTKRQVALDLPPRTEEDILCTLDEPQRRLYEEELQRIRQLVLASRIGADSRAQPFVVLQGLLRLRQICCHPALVDPARGSAGSAKMDALFYLLDQLRSEGHKVLVFSQFTSMLDIIRARMEEEDRPYLLLTGQTTDRDKVVREFQQSADPLCFLLSLKAGGTGLNLTAASYVILYDPWWNPAVENQAIDRTHRIGQTSRVIAYRLLVRDSVEDKIRLLQRQKTALAGGVLGEEGFARLLEPADLEFLFGSEAP